MRVRKSSSLILIGLLYGAAALAEDVPAPGGSFVFTDAKAFRWSEGRQEEIPAFSATVENQTGEDWEEARFLIRAHCGTAERSYEVTLHNLDPEPKRVEETAYSAIGVIAACKPDSLDIQFLSGKKLPAERKSSYLVFGFTTEALDGSFQTSLEGIMDHRRSAGGPSTTTPLYWRDGGAKLLESPGTPPRAFYAFRVEPGEMGLAGFLRTRQESGLGPTERFLRFLDVPPGKAVYAGTFLLRQEDSGTVSVTLEFAPQMLEQLKTVKGREVVAGRLSKPKVQGSFTVGH